ncbi:MAG: hypothetical protein H6581_07410 [Bacteroidia bacterium]|nr:hypothetical protein [Bacteroidia bacterium]
MQKWTGWYNGSFKEIQGFTTPYLQSFFKSDSNSTTDLFIQDPEISFRKLGKREYLRNLSVTLVYQDSTEHEFTLSSKDTIPADMISRVRKTRHHPLRGEDPRWAKKYLFPAVGILAGISTVVTLFYLRSQ